MMLLCLLLILPIATGQRTSKWDECGCDWGTWESWSKCSRQCYGTHVRTRKVWNYKTPNCEGFEACDGGEGGYERTKCNKKCDNGRYDDFWGRCSCPKGYYGDCCGEIVTCAQPVQISNGKVHVSSVTYNSVVTYTCDSSYNMTGSNRRVCGENFAWSGSTPRCLFAESCRSHPCQNGGTCINELGYYTCQCGKGWSGRNCEIDSQPPVYDQCPPSITLRVATHEVNHTWTPPKFHDPHGNNVSVSSNYDSNSFSFPWGDHVVTYTAVKLNNGLDATCTFNVSVRPKPCPPIVSPNNGYVICNGWRTDYGRFCKVGCKSGYVLPRSFDSHQLLVCGASGVWAPDNIPRSCETAPSGSSLAPGPVDCKGDMRLEMLNYISELKKSPFNSFCINNLPMCTPDAVDVICFS